MSAFYGSYFRNRGFGMSKRDRGWEASQRLLIGVYEQIIESECPFIAVELDPSRRARATLG